MIYADGAIPPAKNVTNGSEGDYISTWINNPSKDFVAVTLDDFRANWKYNFGDDKMAQFLSKTPIFNQWDDHEVSELHIHIDIRNALTLHLLKSHQCSFTGHKQLVAG